MTPFPAIRSNARRIGMIALAALAALNMPVQPAAVGAATAQPENQATWVLLTAGSRNTMMSGSTEDLRRARHLRAGDEGLLYVRRAGVAWVVRDPATLRRAEALFAPQQALGARQAQLGSRQAALGSRQAALGAQQARLATAYVARSSNGSDAFEREQAALGSRQDELGQQQDALGLQQDALGREQDRLGQEAEAGLNVLITDAIRQGIARRAD